MSGNREEPKPRKRFLQQRGSGTFVLGRNVLDWGTVRLLTVSGGGLSLRRLPVGALLVGSGATRGNTHILLGRPGLAKGLNFAELANLL